MAKAVKKSLWLWKGVTLAHLSNKAPLTIGISVERNGKVTEGFGLRAAPRSATLSGGLKTLTRLAGTTLPKRGEFKEIPCLNPIDWGFE